MHVFSGEVLTLFLFFSFGLENTFFSAQGFVSFVAASFVNQFMIQFSHLACFLKMNYDSRQIEINISKF